MQEAMEMQADLDKRVKRHDLFTRENAVRQRELLRKTKDKLSKRATKAEHTFVKQMGSLVQGIAMNREMGDMVDLMEEAEERKRRQEYETWNNDVHGVIQKSVTDRVNALPYKQINARKRDEYQQFLDASNKKGQIFRDIIIEEEYDPLESNRKDIKVRHSKFHDPTNRCVQRTNEEKESVDKQAAIRDRKMVEGGRHTLNILDWGDLRIKATPHGHFAKQTDMVLDDGPKSSIQFGGEQVPQTEMLTKSSLMMDHFHAPVGDAAINKEFPLGKRCNINPMEPVISTHKFGNGPIDEGF
jgi:hypothetical protein